MPPNRLAVLDPIIEQAIHDENVPGAVLLVGHEPDFSRVVAELTGGRVDLKKGGLAVVRLENARSRASKKLFGSLSAAGRLSASSGTTDMPAVLSLS